MIIDTHAHIFSADGPFAPGARYRPDYEADIEQWLGLWPAVGVTNGVLVQPSFLGTDNSQMLHAMQERPDLLRGVVVIDPYVGEEQMRLWNQAGVRGIRLNLIGVSDFLGYGGPEWTMLYRRMVELGWHLEVQCEGERLPAFLSILPDIPLVLVIDHFGLPDPRAEDLCAGTAAVLQLAESRSVYMKLSAPYRIRGVDAVKYAARYLTELGPHRLLWGSDWPWTNHEGGRSYEECMSLFCQWVPSVTARTVILEHTPRSLYGFK
jgi:predicted TIM-barrel fold metal-dependent hydrolase